MPVEEQFALRNPSFEGSCDVNKGCYQEYLGCRDNVDADDDVSMAPSLIEGRP